MNDQASREIPKFLGSNPNYVDRLLGRAQQLERFKALLTGTSDRPILLVNAEGGIGKTTFAAEYYRQHIDGYKHLVWLYADAGIAQALLYIAPALGIQFDENSGDSQQRLAVLLQGLRNLTGPSLLVLDNANDPKDLEDHVLALRGLPNFHVIITSRTTEVDGLDAFHLLPLEHTYAKELFKNHCPEHDPQEDRLLDELLKAVGYNTLVIELLAKNLHQFLKGPRKDYGLAQMLEDLGRNGLFGIQGKIVSTVYQAQGLALRKEAPEAILDAMYKLGELSEAEQMLMSMFAVLPAESIAFQWLERLILRDDLEETLSLLALKGWLDYQPKMSSYKVSPVVQQVTGKQNAQRLWEDCEDLVGRLIDKLDYQIGTGHFENVSYEDATYYAHLGDTLASRFVTPQYQLAVLYERLGSFCSTKGDLMRALEYYEDSNCLSEKLHKSHPSNASFKDGLGISYSKLGDVYVALGDLQRALRYYEDHNHLSKELHQSHLSSVPFKNNLAISYEKLGEIHANLGDLQQALRYYEDYNRLGEELYKAHPSNTSYKYSFAVSFAQLGDTHFLLSDLQHALGYHEDCYGLVKELHEADPKNVSFRNGLAISHSKLGNTYAALGDLQRALECYKTETKLSEELYKSHPNNAFFRNGLAASYWKLGNMARELQEMEQARRYFTQTKELLIGLVATCPGFVEFEKNLARVNADLEKLGN